MILQGDCIERLRELQAQSVHCCVTSPPYWGLRDYGVDGQIGLEESPEAFISRIVEVFREVRRVLRDDGTIWVNMGDSYAGSQKGNGDTGIRKNGPHAKEFLPKPLPVPDGLKPKDLVGMPWMVAFALRADGWYLRSDIIWHKPNPMPESVRDRPTKSHEYIFLLSKSERYYYDLEAIKEPMATSSLSRLAQDVDSQEGSKRGNGGDKPNGAMKAVGGSKGAFGPPQSRSRSGNKERKYGDERGRPGSHLGASIPWEGFSRNKRSVWTVATAATPEAHFATYPVKLIEPCILAGCPVGGTVLDPFFGSGTTGIAALQNGREYIGIELNPEYIEIAKRRLAVVQPKMQFG